MKGRKITINSFDSIELEAHKKRILLAANWGMSLTEIAKLCLLSFRQLSVILESDEGLRAEYDRLRAESVEAISRKLHEQAKLGNFQAMSYIMDRDKLSPFKKTEIELSPEEERAMALISEYLVEFGGLLPLPVHCPFCQRDINMNKQQQSTIKHPIH